MIDFRHQQRSFGDGLIRETVDELWEDWMRQADPVLEDEALLDSHLPDDLRAQSLSQSPQGLGIGHLLSSDAGELAI